MSEVGKKIIKNNNLYYQNVDICRFRPFLAQHQCPKLLMSIFDLVPRLSEMGKKILDNNDLFDVNANFGCFRPFLAHFGPGMIPVGSFKCSL